MNNEKTVAQFSTRYTKENLPYWVYTYIPNGSLLDNIYFFHSKGTPIKINKLEEPILFEPIHISSEDFANKFKDTPITVLTSYFHDSKTDNRLIEENELIYGNNVTRIYFPLFFLYCTYWLTKNFDILGNSSYEPTDKKLFTYLVNQPRRHRLIMLDLFTKYDLLKSNVYSFNSKIPPKTLRHTVKHNHSYEINSFNFEQYSPDISGEYEGNTVKAFQIQKIHTDSVLHIAAETVYNTVNFTEKTFVPIVMGKPVIVHGGPDSNKALLTFGFKLYDEIVDYTFDDEPDIVKRTEKLAAEIKRIESKYTPEEVYDLLKTTAEYNRNIAKQILVKGKFIPQKFLQWNNEHCNSVIWKTHISEWFTKYKEKLKSYEQKVTEDSKGSMGKQVKAKT